MLRFVRSVSYSQQLHNAVENVTALVEASDRLAYLLAQYIPEPARPAFLATRAFALEVNKIAPGKAAHVLTSDLKFKFWSDQLAKAFAEAPDVTEPVAFVLRDAVGLGLSLDIGYYHRFLQTRRHWLARPLFALAADICSYGEGTYSQLNYAVHAQLLLPGIAPSVVRLLEASPPLQDLVAQVAAHIGQASAVASMILGVPYYASALGVVTLPEDAMLKHGLSQEAVLRRGADGADDLDMREQLRNVVYDTAVAANDHLLAARSKLAAVRTEIADVVAANKDDTLIARHAPKWRRGLPDAIYTPYMVATPTALYLQRLEKHDFDIFSNKLLQKEWRLAWASFKNYHLRQI